ncbi:MAG: DNA-processing protein DprA [Proteobacteria bacterium]|nr:DNA-processing protein DprA [Pseudomonadota bacterium]
MPTDANLASWLRLTLIPGVGGETRRKLLQAFGLPEAIFNAGVSALRGVVGAPLTELLLQADAGLTAAIEVALGWASEPGNHLVTLADSDYPQALLSSDDPPTLLYLKGRVELLNRPGFAIVGSRNATPQGEANAEAFAAALADVGLTIVSGLALGIDAAAHRGALSVRKESAGSTIAVIGTGANRIYPARNRELARAIAQHGVIVSEFPLETPALAANFPRRNRLIAGLAQGCLVVEAAARSGSLITARLAAEAGRDVFALPGSIHAPLAKGCHQLIKQGAKLVESAQDILEELNWQSATMPACNETAAAKDAIIDAAAAQLLAVLGHDPCDIDTLAARAGLTPEVLLAMLLHLELAGHVSSLPGGRYQRLHRA